MNLNSTPPIPNVSVQHFQRANQTWAIDFGVLDFAEMPLVKLVIDVATRRLLSATLTLAIDDDLPAELDQLVRRKSSPEEIWIDKRYESSFGEAVRLWARQHHISIIHVSMVVPQMRSHSERLLRDLAGFLRDMRFPTPTELGHGIDHWRQCYCAAEQPIPAVKY